MTLRFKFTPSLLTITTGLLAVSLEANYGMSVPAKDLAKQVGGGAQTLRASQHLSPAIL